MHTVTVRAPNIHNVLASAIDHRSIAEKLFARMDVQPADDIKLMIVNTIDALIFYEIWDKLDSLYVALNTPHNTNLNWIEDKYNRTAFGTVDFIPYRGFNGNGTDFYLDTHYNPDGTDATKYGPNSAMLGGVIQDTKSASNTNKYLWGATFGGRQTRIAPNHPTGTLNVYGLHSIASRVFGGTTATSFHMTVTRTGTSLANYRNGISIDNTANMATTALPINNYSLVNYGNRLETGAVGSLSNIVASAHYAGEYLTATQSNDLYYILNEFLAYIGAEARVYRPNARMSVSISPKSLSVGTPITYTLKGEDGIYDNASINITQLGDLTDSNFDKTLDTAIIEGIGVRTDITYSDGVLTLTPEFTGNFTFTRTVTNNGSTGSSHEIDISNAQNLRIICPISAAVCGSPSFVPITKKLRGGNISGAEFGTAFYLDNTAGTDYVNWFAATGANCVRYPHKWERLQSTLFGPLDGGIARYKAGVDKLLAAGLYVIIDPHNYGGRPVNGVKRFIADDQLPVTAFIDYWLKLIDYLGPNDKLIFNLMNEPAGINTKHWYGAAQSVVDVIRAAGHYNHCQVPGTSYSSASTWVSSGNAARFENFVDPIDNCSFDIHQYFDPKSDGSSGVCTVNAANRIDAAISWANSFAPKKKLFFGEFAVGYPEVAGQEQCAIELSNVFSKFETNPDSVTGGSAWGAGPWWSGAYIYRWQNGTTGADTSFLTMLKEWFENNEA